MTVKRPFQPEPRRKSASKSSAAYGHLPRVSKLMALAICFDQMIRDGKTTDQAELARLGRVTRARLTQIMALLNLAPPIQDLLLNGSIGDNLTERCLRPVAAVSDWNRQLEMLEAS